jgi:hypothetical protein
MSDDIGASSPNTRLPRIGHALRIARAAAVVSAAVLLWGCNEQAAVLEPIKRASLKPARPARAVSPSEWRAELREAYRLAPDSRFLLAFGEIDRLAGALPAPAGKAATATFSDGRWIIQAGEAKAGTLPELPDFTDYVPLLVAHAKAAIHGGKVVPTPRPSRTGQDAFLMPALLKGIDAAEPAQGKERSFRDASRGFARLAFQMSDPLELAPLIPARALALLAVERARDASSGVEEEILLAHAMGYTRHAETLAATLPADAPLRAFETLDARAISDMASKPGASEEARYLAVRRATSGGNLARWREARQRFMPDNDSVAVIATGLDIDLPAQVEVSQKRDLLGEALPRAVLRELSRLPSTTPPQFEGVNQFQTALKGAAEAARGSLWDGTAVKAYYQAAHYAPLIVERWPPLAIAPTPGMGERLVELSQPYLMMPPDPRGDTRGAPLVTQRMHKQFQTAPPAFTQMYAEIRALVRWLDTRPKDRFELADFSRYSLQDPRAAEVLFRSLMGVLGEGDRKIRADSAVYLGDWDALHRLLGSPEITPPEATAILWSWYTARVETERLISEYERLIARFPSDWNATNQYVDLLRDRKEYLKSCEVVERWLARNPDPGTPGHFHAHVRLSHNYVLNHQPEKGLRLLEGMHETEPFQRRVRKRELANVLAAVGRLAEAEAMMREAAEELRWGSDTPRDLAQILWQEGKDGEAVDILGHERPYLQAWEICQALEKDFAGVVMDLPPERRTRAIDAIAKKRELASYSTCVARGFANAGRWEDAMLVAGRLPPPGPDPMDLLISQYGYMKSWKGGTAAAEWLEKRVPAERRNPLSIKALTTKNDDVLWDVIGTPNPSDKAEWVWFYRAVAFALRGSDGDPRQAQLLAYYGKDNPEPPHAMGRYLVGLGAEDEMFALTGNSPSRSELAYSLGARAQHEKRFGDACEWYRVAAESGEGTTPRSLAMYALGDWAAVRQGISQLEADASRKK